MKHFHINAGVRLPDNFEGDTPEALAFLLYEMMRVQATETNRGTVQPPSGINSSEILAWLSRTEEDIWYQTSISYSPEELTEEYQDKEDGEIENIIIKDKIKSSKILKKRKQ